jgi:hypothetical protein
MTPAAEPVSPKTTLAVILGASDFTNWKELSNTAFASSAEDFKRYLFDEDGFNLPRDHLLPLFDTTKSQSDILVAVADFLSEKYKAQSEGGIRDLLLYYVGHGNFTAARNYCLAVRDSRPKVDGTLLRMSDLAGVIRNNAGGLRRFLILDCCFAGKAIKEIQAGPLVAAREEIMESFAREGTTLLCSSTEGKVSLAPEGSKYTMFSGALLEVLRNGVAKIDTPLSMEQLGTTADSLIRERYPGEAVRPTVLSPDPVAEKTSAVPFFPNAATRPRKLKEQVEEVSTKLSQLSNDVTTVGKWVKDLQSQRTLEMTDLKMRLEALESRPADTAEGASEPTKHSETNHERRERILASAPTWVAEQVFEWRSARRAGMIWVAVAAAMALTSILSLFGVLPMHLPILSNPVNWLPALVFAWGTALNVRNLLGWESAPGTAAAYSEKVKEWEMLDIVIASQRARYFRLFGSLKVTSPWFEIAHLIYFIQVVCFGFLAWFPLAPKAT